MSIIPQQQQDEVSHFPELDEVLRLINSDEKSHLIITKNHNKIREILNRYLEFPTLLDPYLQALLISYSSKPNDDDDDEEKNSIQRGLATHARHLLRELFKIDNNAVNVNDAQNHQKYNDNPFNDVDSNSTNGQEELILNLNENLKSIQTLCKVRGYKTIQRFFPHEVSDLEPLLHCLLAEQKNLLKLEWEGVRVLLLWLAMLLTNIPFDLDSIISAVDSCEQNFEQKPDRETDSKYTHHDEIITGDAIQVVKNLVQGHLNAAGTTREAAAVCLASLLARPDASNDFCNECLDWALCVIQDKDHKFNDETHSIYLKMGVVQTLSVLFKIAPRVKLLSESFEQMCTLWEALIQMLECEDKVRRPALLVRKLLIKLFSRIGCAYLPPRVAGWRYDRGRRSLFEQNNKETRLSPTKSLSNEYDVSKDINDDSDLVRDEVEDVVEMLLRGLQDEATVVRWSSAKGIGRITERLPVDCADDVVEAVLELCDERENDSAWHGSCLALAELSRRGLLLPKRLNTVVPIIVKAIQYDLKRGQHSVGAHVRDAACYTCWAFARAYDPSILKPFISELSRELVNTCLFDRELNCRRAASAAFQECVGRQGANVS